MSRSRASLSNTHTSEGGTTRRTTRSSTALMNSMLNTASPLGLSNIASSEQIDSKEDSAVVEEKRNYYTRSREPSISGNLSQDNHKKIMYILSAGEEEQIIAAEAWVTYGYKPNQPMQREIIINDNKPLTKILAKVNPEDTLYIHSHMYTETQQVGGFIHLRAKIKGEKIEEKTYTPDELATHLELKGLNKNHRKLKLFCCYSDLIAYDIYAALVNKGFNQIILSAYKGETTLITGTRYKAAGLSLEEAAKLKNEYKNESGEAQYFRPEQVIGELHRANIDGKNRDKITPESYQDYLNKQTAPGSFRP